MQNKDFSNEGPQSIPEEERRLTGAEDDAGGLPAILYACPEIDVEKGLAYCGDADDYLFALETYEASVGSKAEQIEKSLAEEDLEACALALHSLKSASGAIGAVGLSESAKALEEAARRGDRDTLAMDIPVFLEKYRALGAVLGEGIKGPELHSPEAEEAGRENGLKPAALSDADHGARLPVRVLLAEDMDVNAQIIQRILQTKGIAADLAKDGQEACAHFAASAPGTYAAVLMDVRMPRMDGLEATERIRAMERPDAKKIPIIALTAGASDEDVQSSRKAGMDAHLSKPVEPDALFAALEKLIREEADNE